MEKQNSAQIVASLESLCKSLQEAMSTNPAEVEPELARAGVTVEQIIKDAVPNDERESWLAELNHLTGGSGAEKSGSVEGHERSNAGTEADCFCDQVRKNMDETSRTDADSRQMGYVECIHGCGKRFCSATCRKKQIRGHSRVCSSIARKALLRRIGITGDDELF